MGLVNTVVPIADPKRDRSLVSRNAAEQPNGAALPESGPER